VHSEGGQATVEWVALVLAAALVLGAAAAFAGREADAGVGEAVAKRITRTARGVGPAPAAGTAAPPQAGAPAPGAAAPPPTRAAPPTAPSKPSPLSSLGRAVGGTLADIGRVAKHGWIVCLGYERWKHELEHPSAPTEPLPADVAVSIVNTCFNPHDYLLED
jgi:hypothetical protein